MKKKFTIPKCLLLLFVFINAHQVNAQCVSNFSFALNANGNVSFQSTSTNTIAATMYSWNFGNSQTGFGQSVSTNYNANITYSVTLTITNPSSFTPCNSTITKTLAITNVTCFLVPSFVFTVGAANSVSFASTTTGTLAGTTYTWDYGDSNTGTGVTSSHIYGGPGGYNAQLIIDNNNGCRDSIVQWVNVTTPCALNASFISTQLGNGYVFFNSTSTGTVNPVSYSWLKNSFLFAANNPTAVSVFANGTHTIALEVVNTSFSIACTSSVTQVITVTSNTCNLASSFAFTAGAAGSTSFVSTSTGTNANTMHYWDFGDGFNITGNTSQVHTYTNSGSYTAILKVYDSSNLLCFDSVFVPVNITTAPCIANSNFTLTQLGPGNWQATPAYPWNVSNAIWSWGDATFSNQLYTSHTYSPTGLYTICLSVTVSCGGTSSTCAAYAISRMANPITMAVVNVVMPQSISIGIKNNFSINQNSFLVYPNPSSGEFELKISGLSDSDSPKIKVYNITGSLVYESANHVLNTKLSQEIKLNHEPDGIYFIKVETTEGVISRKIILKR